MRTLFEEIEEVLGPDVFRLAPPQSAQPFLSSTLFCRGCRQGLDDLEALLRAVSRAPRRRGRDAVAVFLLQGQLHVYGAGYGGAVDFYVADLGNVAGAVERLGLDVAAGQTPEADVLTALYLRRMALEPHRIPELGVELGAKLSALGVRCSGSPEVFDFAGVPFPSSLCTQAFTVAQHIGVAALYVLRGMGHATPSIQIDVEAAARGEARVVHASCDGPMCFVALSDGTVFTQNGDTVHVYPGLAVAAKRGRPGAEAYYELWGAMGRDREFRRRVYSITNVVGRATELMNWYLSHI